MMRTEIAGQFQNCLLYTSIGFAIQLFWLFILFFQASFFSDSYHYLDEAHYVLLSLAFLIAFPAACFLVGYYREKVTKYLRKKSVHFLMGLCGTGMRTKCWTPRGVGLESACTTMRRGRSPWRPCLLSTSRCV